MEVTSAWQQNSKHQTLLPFRDTTSKIHIPIPFVRNQKPIKRLLHSGEGKTGCIEVSRKIHGIFSPHSLFVAQSHTIGEKLPLLASSWGRKEETGPHVEHSDILGSCPSKCLLSNLSWSTNGICHALVALRALRPKKKKKSLASMLLLQRTCTTVKADTVQHRFP